MIVSCHKNFDKKYARLRPNIKQKFKQRRNLFIADPFHPLLNNHALRGRYQGVYSINVSGDWRAIYIIVGPDTALFIDIDTHSNLYK